MTSIYGINRGARSVCVACLSQTRKSKPRLQGLVSHVDHAIEAIIITPKRTSLETCYMIVSVRLLVLVCASVLCVAGCASRGEPTPSTETVEAKNDRGLLSRLNPFSRDDSEEVLSRSAPEAGVGVNGHLWRATLETLSFMPLTEVDPFGGVIITDWFANPELPGERFKATVYILDSRLRADALSVQVFKQVLVEDGIWLDANVDPATRLQIENAILTRARQLRIAALD